MRKQRLLIWMTCLLLGAVSGCNNKPKILQGKHHSPVSGDIGSDGKASSCRPTVPVSVLVDEGGTVSPSGTLTIEPPATATSSAELFDIESKLNGTPTPVCANEASTIHNYAAVHMYRCQSGWRLHDYGYSAHKDP